MLEMLKNAKIAKKVKLNASKFFPNVGLLLLKLNIAYLYIIGHPYNTLYISTYFHQLSN